jgi:hypothetical protein
VKICVSAMFSITGEYKRLPPTARAMLPKEWTSRRIAKAIREHHDPIAHLFGQDKTMQYMWQDSKVLIDVLTRLMRKSIPCLPMHDGIMVQGSMRDVAQKITQEVSLGLTDVVLPIGKSRY